MPDHIQIHEEIGRQFMEHTKYRSLGRSDQEKGIPQPPLELPMTAGKPVFKLKRPVDLDIPSMDLRTAIERRRSIRSYEKIPLRCDELSFLLWCTQGVRQISGSVATFRTVPSAGARHAFETYLLVNDVEGLLPGLYRYLALSHCLQLVASDPALHIDIAHAALDQDFIMRSGVVFLWTAVPYRMTWRYGERGYRDLHLDAGHVCQNLYLAALAVGCGVCAIAAFDDDLMASILGIDGVTQFLIYMATVGKTGRDR
ncbi:SagB/ThcOx family dehydrogenase [Methanoregula sp.]|uniref:SagB/ThcOx family dehydrogenase n=1 Tax=Methanoregula sp. TaxID=2052170 RepID=UPI002C1840BE|nr:SagB/ThcOx family dehydrogenase [Methanoregula sp.]HVP95962.1 SagB/ThcOx family dehydrogenase [Methanoregula sp.]